MNKINKPVTDTNVGIKTNYTKSCTLKKKELKGIIVSNIDGDMRLDNIEWLLTDLQNWIDQNYVSKEWVAKESRNLYPLKNEPRHNKAVLRLCNIKFKQVSNPLDPYEKP